MRIGIRAHDMEKLPFEELVQKIHEKGFLCTQLALKKSIREFNVSPEAMTPGMALYMKEIFEKNHVDVAVLGCYLNLANPNADKLAEIKETYKAHIRFASLLGCGVVGTETGAVNEAYCYEEANHSEKALEIFIKSCEEIVHYAEKMGVIFGIEPVYKHIVCDSKRARRVLDAIASPNLQIILDPVNLLSADNCDYQDEIMEEAFDLLGKDIAVIHAKDFKREGNELVSIPAGTGNLHMPVLMKFIKERKPFIHVLLENTKPENAEDVKKFMEMLYHGEDR